MKVAADAGEGHDKQDILDKMRIRHPQEAGLPMSCGHFCIYPLAAVDEQSMPSK